MLKGMPPHSVWPVGIEAGAASNIQESDVVMKENLPITDEEWEKLRNAHFSTQDFVEALELFDSIRHIAGNSDFSADVYADMQKVKELAGKVFSDGQRGSAGELFFEAASLDSIMRDLEDWVTDIREAFAALNKIRPESFAKLDDMKTKMGKKGLQ
jgi:hypothetical protein